MRYLLSALITPFKGGEATFRLQEVDIEFARKFVSENFVSAVGHQSTASLLSTLLGVEVPLNRVTVWLEPGDQALAIQFLERVAEGQVLTLDELIQWYNNNKIKFVLITRIS